MAEIVCDLVGLSDASFRGAHFWVDSDKGAYGRRIITHEYPMRDDPDNEDMGEKARSFSVTGYVVGTDANEQKDAVKAACTARGAALLCLPAESPFQAVCKGLNVSRSKDRQGFFELTFEFQVDSSMGGSPAPTSMYERLISSVLTELPDAIEPMFAAAFNGDNILAYASTNAQERIDTFATEMIGVLEQAGSSASNDATATLLTTAITMGQNAPYWVSPGPNDPPVETIIGVMATLFSGVNNVLAPLEALGPMKLLSQFSINEDPPVTSGPTSTQDYANAVVFNSAVRMMALVSYAQAASAVDYTNRSDAIQARADIAELFGQEIQRTDDEVVTALLVSARDYAVRAVSEQIATLVPVVTIEAGVSLPALYWAGRLYDDATRSQQISERNDVRAPAFMPQVFEALLS